MGTKNQCDICGNDRNILFLSSIYDTNFKPGTIIKNARVCKNCAATKF